MGPGPLFTVMHLPREDGVEPIRRHARPGENPLTLLVKAIQGNTIRPVANPPTISAVPVSSVAFTTAGQ